MISSYRDVDVLTEGEGMIDPSMKCIAWNGRLLVIGFAGGTIEKVALNRVLLKNISIVGLHWGMYATKEKGDSYECLERHFRSDQLRQNEGNHLY